MEYILKIKSIIGKKYKFSYTNLLLRGLIGGLTIAVSVVLTRYGGPLFGGAFVSLPAVVLSTMVITYFVQDPAFSLAVTKSTTISGLVNVFIYSLGVRYFYPLLGLVTGTVISFSLSLISAYAVYSFLRRTS